MKVSSEISQADLLTLARACRGHLEVVLESPFFTTPIGEERPVPTAEAAGELAFALVMLCGTLGEDKFRELGPLLDQLNGAIARAFPLSPMGDAAFGAWLKQAFGSAKDGGGQ